MTQPAEPDPQPAVPNPQPAAPNPQYAPPPASVVPGQLQHAPRPSSQTGRAAARGKRTFAIVALVAGGLQLLLGPLNAIVFATVLRSGGSPSVLSLLSGVVSVVSVVLAIVAMALAVVSIVRGEQAWVLAGIALGIGIAALVGVLATLLQVGLLAGI